MRAEGLVLSDISEKVMRGILPKLLEAAEAGYGYWRRTEGWIGPVHETSVRLEADYLREELGLSATYFVEVGPKRLILTVNW